MKVGPGRTSLTERLSAARTNEAHARTLEAGAGQAADLIDVTLTTFKAACEALNSAAQTTIETDLAAQTLAYRRSISALTTQMNADLHLIRRVTRFSPWVVAMCLILLIGAGGSVSWFLVNLISASAQMSALQSEGITRVQTTGGTVLLLETGRWRVTTCHIASHAVTCLTPRRNP